MTTKLYAFDCGQLTLPTNIFLEGEEGMITVPVPAFLIQHDKGSVLFDTGLNPATRTDPAAYLGPDLNSMIEVHHRDEEEIQACLARVEVGTEEITHLVNSHLHFDHCGGNCKITNAPVIVQKREWEWAMKPDPDRAYFAGDYDTGQDIKTIDGEFDIFGDRSVMCIPTYGHTPGHQSLKVQTEGGEFVLTGDACYLRRTLEELHLPAALHDRDQALASLAKLRDLKARGARLIYGHDPEHWSSVTQAPKRLG